MGGDCAKYRVGAPETAASSLIRAAASAGEVRCPQIPTNLSQLPPHKFPISISVNKFPISINKFPISVNFAEFQRELLTRGGVEMPRFYAAVG